jgi:glycosyltransferase involved in cell wall biosynthesis
MEVCIISENGYPSSKGGVSEWCHSLINRMKNVQFKIFALSVERKLVYRLPRNVNDVMIKTIQSAHFLDAVDDDKHIDAIVNEVKPAMLGHPLDCEKIIQLLKKCKCEGEKLLGSNANWEAALKYYEKNFPHKPFIPFYFSWISLFYLLYKTLEIVDSVPRSNIYHSLNSGYAGLLGCLAKLGTKASLIVTEHGLYLKERKFELNNSEIPEWLHGMYTKFFESLVRTSYKYSDKITSVCQDHIKYQKEVEPNLKNLMVIHNGIDTKRFRNHKSLNENNRTKFNIGTITRITPIKGILTFIRAASHVLKEFNAKFIIVGEVQDEEYFEDCQKLLEKLELESHVAFKGFQNSLDWYPQFDVFVLSSLSEGFPLTLLEALSCEVPCIATNVGGVSEILDKDYLVQKWDAEGLADKISWLLTNPEKRERIGIKGREIVESQFSLSKMVQEYHELYEAIV